MRPSALWTLFATTVFAAPLTSDPDKTPLPLIIWHGLGDNYEGDGIKEVGELAQSVHPGTYVYTVRLDEDPSADRSASFWGNVTEQVEKVCEDIAADPILSTAPAIDALGFSQGGLFLRGYIEKCNKPPVRSLVTFGSPHNGIVDFAACGTTDWVCKGAMAMLKSNTWASYVQGRLVPAQYYRPTDPETGMPSEEYLEYSNFLADANNERLAKNATYAKNMAKLEKFVMYMFAEDTTVVPKETAWFAEVNLTSSTVTPLEERDLFKLNWLGLREVKKKGGLVFKTTPGRHMELSDDVLMEAFKEYFGSMSANSKSQAALVVQSGANLEL